MRRIDWNASVLVGVEVFGVLTRVSCAVDKVCPIAQFVSVEYWPIRHSRTGHGAVTIGSQGHGHEESSPEGGAGDAHGGRHSAELDNDGGGQRSNNGGSDKGAR